MKRFLLFAALLLTSSASAATISGTSCPGSGCNVSYVSGTAYLSVQVTGTWVGTIVFESSHDSASGFGLLRAYPQEGGLPALSITGNGRWLVPTGGLLYFRSRATAWTSGIATITTYSSAAGPSVDNVQAAIQTPDGGLPVAVGGVVAVSSPDGGLPVTLGAATVSTVLTTPDGGLPVNLGAATVNTNVVTPDGGLLVSVPDPVRVVGPTFGEVAVSGTVSLSNASLGALGTESCTTGVARSLSVSTTPISVPSSPMAGRSRILVVNTSGTQNVKCVVDDTGSTVPTCATPGVGLTLFPNGGSVIYAVRDSVPIKCVSCTSAVPVEYQEEACVPP